jgi:hypothetical protein
MKLLNVGTGDVAPCFLNIHFAIGKIVSIRNRRLRMPKTRNLFAVKSFNWAGENITQIFQPTSQDRFFLQKLAVCQSVNKPFIIYGTRRHRVYSGQLPVPTLIYKNPVTVLPVYLFNIHFNIILPDTHTTSKFSRFPSGSPLRACLCISFSLFVLHISPNTFVLIL